MRDLEESDVQLLYFSKPLRKILWSDTGSSGRGLFTIAVMKSGPQAILNLLEKP